MNISIGKGIGEFTFGQTEEEIIVIQGQSNKKYTDEFGDIYVKYNSLEMTFKFEKEHDYKLGWIETSNIKTKLLDFSPWKTQKEILIPKLNEILSDTPEVEDYGSFESVTYNNSWLEFQFEYGNLKQINFGVLFDKQNNPKSLNT